MWRTSGRAFTPAEVRLIEAVASQVALAVENAELARQTAEKLDEMERLLSVSRALSSTIELGPLLRTLLQQVTRTAGADSAGVWLADPATGELEPFAGYHVTPALVEQLRGFRIVPERSPLYADAIARRVAVTSKDAPRDPGLPPGLAALAPHRAQLFAPIVANERLVGAIIVVWWERELTCGDRELALVDAMASQAGLALEHARLFEDDRRKLAELSALYELSRAVTGQLETAQLVEAVHREVARVLDVRNLAIFLYDAGRRELEVVLREWGGTREVDLPRRRALGVGLATAVVTRRAPLRTADYAAACAREGVVPVPEALALRHWLGVPIVAGEDVLGALTLADAARPFTEADERLLSNIASLTALALRSARLYEERSATYRELTLAQDHLVRTEKLRALGEMAAGVAHDFNNLLAVIVGRAELLLRRAPAPELARGLETIHQAALDGAQTVRRIQEFTRTRRTRPFRRVDLLEIVREVVEMTRPRWKDEAQSRGVSYEVEIERRVRTVGRRAARGAARGLHQPPHQRARGDARGRASRLRAAHGGDRRRGDGARHRDRHVTRDRAPGLRALLHDEGPAGQRSRARRRLGHRDAAWRDGGGGQPARGGEHLHGAAARSPVGAGAAGRLRARPPGAARARPRGRRRGRRARGSPRAPAAARATRSSTRRTAPRGSRSARRSRSTSC